MDITLYRRAVGVRAGYTQTVQHSTYTGPGHEESLTQESRWVRTRHWRPWQVVSVGGVTRVFGR